MPQDSHELPPLFSSYRIPDPETFASNLLQAFERGSAAFAQLADRPDAKIGPYTPASEFSAATETYTKVSANGEAHSTSSKATAVRSFIRVRPPKG